MNEMARFQRLSSVRRRGVVFPGGSGAPGRVGCSARETVEQVVVREPLGHAREQSGRVDAVVVGERDDVCAHVRRARRCGRATARSSRLQQDDIERASADEIRDPPVVVLVDDDDPQRRIVLRLQRVEEATELVRPPDRRDDEVERRKLPRHGP